MSQKVIRSWVMGPTEHSAAVQAFNKVKSSLSVSPTGRSLRLGVAYRIARGRQSASKHCLRLHRSQRLTDVLRNRIHALAGHRLAEVRHFPSLPTP